MEDGDTINIDYVGSVDGVEFDGGNTQGMGTDLVIGSGSYIDDFEDQLIGAHPGDQVDVYVTFPEDYGVEELNGKEALFQVTVMEFMSKSGFVVGLGLSKAEGPRMQKDSVLLIKPPLIPF